MSLLLERILLWETSSDEGIDCQHLYGAEFKVDFGPWQKGYVAKLLVVDFNAGKLEEYDRDGNIWASEPHNGCAFALLPLVAIPVHDAPAFRPPYEVVQRAINSIAFIDRDSVLTPIEVTAEDELTPVHTHYALMILNALNVQFNNPPLLDKSIVVLEEIKDPSAALIAAMGMPSHCFPPASHSGSNVDTAPPVDWKDVVRDNMNYATDSGTQYTPPDAADKAMGIQ